MLLVVAGTLLWFPSVVGWGLLALTLLARGDLGRYKAPPVVFPTLVGLGVLGTLANLANFFVPVSPAVSSGLLVIGWIALLFCFRAGVVSPPSLRSVGVALCLLVYIAFVGREFVWWNQDSGLYHVPAIRWLTQTKLVLGLGNLHGRLAFNSLWFSTAAALEAPGLEGKSSFLLSAILLYSWGLSLYRAVSSFSITGFTPSALFFLITGLVWLNLVNGARLNAPAPDLPGIAAALLTVFAAWKATESDKDWDQYALLAGLIATIGIAVKLSNVLLMLTPACLGWWLLASKPGSGSPARVARLSRRIVAFGTIVMLPWLIRGVLLSGTIIYPISFTRIASLRWAVPVETIDWERWYVRSWARQPGKNALEVLSNWDWFLGWWLPHYARDRVVLATAAMLLIGGAALVVTTRRRPPSSDGSRRFALLLAMPVLAMVFWFITAPDIRFGEGFFWSLGILFLTAGLSRVYGVYLLTSVAALRPHVRRRLFGACLLVLALGAAPWRARHWMTHPGDVLARLPALIVEIPDVPLPQVAIRVTDQGLAVHCPQVDGTCWNGPLPCTPFFNAKLRAQFGTDNRPTQFFYSH